MAEEVKKTNGCGIASTVLGAIAVLVSIIPILNWLTWLFWIPALVCAIIGLVKKDVKKGTAIAGLVLSLIAIICEFCLYPLIFAAMF